MSRSQENDVFYTCTSQTQALLDVVFYAFLNVH